MDKQQIENTFPKLGFSMPVITKKNLYKTYDAIYTFKT